MTQMTHAALPIEDDYALKFHQLTFQQCMDCMEMIAPPVLATRTLACRHVVHHTCDTCRWPACVAADRPTLNFPFPLDRLYFALSGANGVADWLMGNDRRAVMHASSMGLLFLCTPVIWLGEAVFEYDATDFVYLIITTILYGIPLGRYWVYGPETIACLALWISGRYGYEWGHGWFLDFFSSVGVATCVVCAVRSNDVSGSAALGILLFWSSWSRPRFWDFNPGTLFGVYGVGAVTFLQFVLAPAIANGVIWYTFRFATILHAWFVVHLFPRQRNTKTFGTRLSSVLLSVIWTMVFLYSRRHN